MSAVGGPSDITYYASMSSRAEVSAVAFDMRAFAGGSRMSLASHLLLSWMTCMWFLSQTSMLLLISGKSMQHCLKDAVGQNYQRKSCCRTLMVEEHFKAGMITELSVLLLLNNKRIGYLQV